MAWLVVERANSIAGATAAVDGRLMFARVAQWQSSSFPNWLLRVQIPSLALCTISSAGRAPLLHGGCRGFDSFIVHHAAIDQLVGVVTFRP